MPDSAAFGRDTEPFRRELFAHCYRMLGSVADAEDLVRETYLRAWRSSDSFEGRSSVRTWLYQIATNACLAALSRRDRRVLPSGQYDAELDPTVWPEDAGPDVAWLDPVPDTLAIPEAADPAVIVTARESLRLALIASLQYLPPRQRAVLVLRDVLEFPAAQVAVMLDTTTASVKSALQRARARLDDDTAGFENADAAALERLLVEDVILEATPLRSWFSGRRACIPFLRDRVLGGVGDWRMLATGANGQPAAAVYARDADGQLQPYGVCVLTVTDRGISQVTSFGNPGLLAVFGFPPEPGMTGPWTPTSR